MRPKVFFRDSECQIPPDARRKHSPNNSEAFESGSEAETDVEPVSKRTHRRMDSQHENGTYKRTRTVSQSRDVAGRKALLRACFRGDLSRVLECLSFGDDPSDRDYAGTTAMHAAALQGDKEILEALLHSSRAIVDIRSGNDELDTPLMDAVSNGSPAAVKLLLDHGADPRASNKEGKIAIDFIDWDEDGAEEIESLIKTATARVRSQKLPLVTRETATPGTFPPKEQDSEVAEFATPHLDLLTKAGRGVATQRAARGDLAFVGMALEQGWRPTAEALVKAAKYGHSEVAELLLAFGVPVNALWEGQTALLATAGRGHSSTVKLLLDSGADRMYKDSKGRTCASLVSFLPEEDTERRLLEGTTEASIQKPESESRSSRPVPSEKDASPTNSTAKSVDGEDKSSQVITDKEKPQPLKFSRDLRKDSRTSVAVGGDSSTSITKDFRMPFDKIDFRSIKRKKRTNSQAVHSEESTPETENIFSSDHQVKHELINSVKQEHKSLEPLVSRDQGNPSYHDGEPQNLMSDGQEEQRVEQETPESNKSNVHVIPKDKKTMPEERTSEEPISPDHSVEVDEHRRSAETIEFATRRERDRRAREAQMLESLANEERRRHTRSRSPSAGPAPCSPVSESENITPSTRSEHEQQEHQQPSQNQDQEQEQEQEQKEKKSELHQPRIQTQVENYHQSQDGDIPPQQSVKWLPWALRQLAYSRMPQMRVLPLLVYYPDQSESAYFLDVQLALFLGRPQLHREMPNLIKLVVTPQQKVLMWNFVKPWLASPRIQFSLDDESSEKALFMSLNLSWIRTNEVQSLVGTEVPKVTVSLAGQQPKPLAKSSEFAHSALPLRFALKVRQTQRNFSWT